MQLKICLFGPDIADSTTFKRCARLVDAGCEVSSFTFSRNLMKGSSKPTWTSINLSTIRNGAAFQKLALLPAVAARLVRYRKTIVAANVIYARNLDMALLALCARRLFSPGALLVYEVLDIHKTLLRSDWLGRVMRRLEAAVLRQASILVLSSNGFLDNYFQKTFRHVPETFLLENKISFLDESSRQVFTEDTHAKKRKRSSTDPLTIAFVGRLACTKSIELLLLAARERPVQVRIKLVGSIENIPDDLLNALRAQENIELAGQYSYPDDLAGIYQDVDLNWCLNFRDDDSENNTWLLPNRYYEGGFFGVPVLARAGTEMGNLATELDVGWQLDEPYQDSLLKLLDTVGDEKLEEKSGQLGRMPMTSFVDFDDHAELRDRVIGKLKGQ